HKCQENRKPPLDVIVRVNTLKQVHKKNIKLNKYDYSLTARLFFNYGSYNWLKSGAHICYMTYIPFNGKEYKIGTIELEDFLNDLNNWETFYMAGRMQKPILIAKSTKEIEKAIEKNRTAGISATKMLLEKNTKEKDFYISLGSLSYIGDTRMGIAENPDKVKNIVEGRYDFYQAEYGSKLNIENGNVIITDDYDIEKMPQELKDYLQNVPKEELSVKVREFLTQKNKSQSMAQTVKGIFTTGPVKALKYANAKLKRKQKK
ncbi:MAG: hypothetical protein IJ093_02525, partial [Bacilli bacterium]|nr:hypothetical protein [Bacilli bacterium]